MQLFLPVLTGLLLIASFPRADQGYLAWVAFVPLVAFVFRAKTAARAFWGGFIAGGIQYFALLIWIPAVLARYGGVPAGLAWGIYGLMVFVLASFPGAACALTEFLIKRGGNSFLLAFPAAWVALEFVQSFAPFGGFPWLLAGYSQTNYLRLIQIADITGVYGVTFLILSFNTAIVWAALRRGGSAHSYWPLAAAVALIALSVFYGTISLRRWERVEPVFSAAMLQGNLSFDEPTQVLIEKSQSGYLQMANRLKPAAVDLLVLPESPSPADFDNNASYRQMLEHLARRFSLGLVFNNVSSREAEGGARYFNSAYFLDGNGTLVDVYDKIHLVPFGEYIPLKSVFFFAETISKDVGSFSPGRDYRIVKLGFHPLNAVICFETVFPGLVRRFVKTGSQLIVNLTNDGWYGNSVAPYQHLVIGRWRAVENRRYMLRAANSGISAIIEPTGKIQTATGILQEAICRGRFAFISQQSLYTRCGDVFAFLCAIISCGLVVYVFIQAFARSQRT